MKKNKDITHILFITLTNIGDAILTTPVLGVLLREFPCAKITVIVSPAAANLFHGNPIFYKVIVYDKFLNFRRKMKLFMELRREKFDLVVDLKNMFISSLLFPKYRMPLWRKRGERKYKRDIFLSMLKDMFVSKLRLQLDAADAPFYIWTSKEDRENANRLVEECCSGKQKKFIAISPFAKSDTKSWSLGNFAELIKRLKAKENLEIILVGSKKDEKNSIEFIKNTNDDLCNLCGKTSLRELAEVLKRCSCLITNDSAVMHLASAVGTTVVAIFGPTDDKKYAPRGEQHKILTAELDCQPCEKAQCVFGKKPVDCLEFINVDEVFKKVEEILLKWKEK